ncbi:hypothetical protein QP572_02280 [Brevibacterium sp. UMB10442]|nr:hypothetical protein [Brevibacterium sp. UMB10442]
MTSSVVKRAVSGNVFCDVIMRDGTVTTDIALIDALERAGCFVIGNPQAFRYKHPGKKAFTHPSAKMVAILDSNGAVKTVYTLTQFRKQFQLVGEQ